MGRPRKIKDVFAELDEDYKTLIENATDADIRNKVSEVAFNESENIRLKTEDADLAEKKQAVKEAGQQYSEASKQNKLRISYARQVLDGRGKI